MSKLEEMAIPISRSPLSRSLRQRAVSASWWTTAPQPLQIGFRFAQSVIMARFIAPEHFGLMALVGILLNGLVMFSDIGTESAAIRSGNGDDPDFLRTAWTLKILRGTGLWLACAATAIPFAWFYNEPILLLMIPVAGSTMFISGFGTTAVIAFARRIELRTPTLFVMWMMPISFLISIGMAYWLRDAWALAWGGVLTTLTSVILGHLILPGVRHRFCWRPEYVRELFSFGRWVFVSTMFTFIAMQADKLMLAKFVEMRVVGVYGIALVLAHMPITIIGALASSVLFPVFAEQYRDDPVRMAQRALKARRLLMSLGLILSLGVFVIAPSFFRLLYLQEFWDAGWMTRFMLASVWITMLYSTSGHAVLAIGDSRSMALANGCNAIVTVIGCFAGFYLAGVPGFIIGFAAGTVAAESVLTIRLRRAGIDFGGQDLRLTFVGAVAVAAMLATRKVVEVIDPSLPFVAEAVGLLAISLIGWRILPELKHLLRKS
jgi:O-antigen/teichoic acid export membrane protein